MWYLFHMVSGWEFSYDNFMLCSIQKCTWATFFLGSPITHFSLLSFWPSNLPDVARRTQRCITSLKESEMIHFWCHLSFYYSGAFQTEKNTLHFHLQSLYVIPKAVHNSFDPSEANVHSENKTVSLRRNRCAKCNQWVSKPWVWKSHT